MDLSYGPELEAFRAEVRTFLTQSWPPRGDEAELPRPQREQRFRERAIERGYVYRSIPKTYGGSEQPPDVLRAQIIREEFGRARAPAEVQGNGVNMLVPTLLDQGAEWQRERFIPKTLTGEYHWAQGYSEPGSGSDLASLRTRGELVGDEWVIHGQKIWTSQATHCQYMFALIRTEPDAPKHAGISYLLIPLKQPGIAIRPLRQMDGQAEFAEVFFDGARTPADWIVGKRGDGWKVSRSTLKHERSAIGNTGRAAEQLESLLRLAKKATLDGEPALQNAHIRERLAALQGLALAHKYSGFYQLSCDVAGKDAGVITLMNKLLFTNFGHEVAQLAVELVGNEALLAPDAKSGVRSGQAKWLNQFMGSLGIAIAGGTSNIQRNIIAERGLGLPRDATSGGGA
ncbi:MAG TPA: acyl-CoA dehydrogenase family protein [Myxococcota bacterium]|nr:acyl-CoA dehydrogenase family protein [Myxococcota bacterium]